MVAMVPTNDLALWDRFAKSACKPNDISAVSLSSDPALIGIHFRYVFRGSQLGR